MAKTENNFSDIQKSKLCGCVYCFSLFEPSKIVDWQEYEGNKTALCPNCGIERVVCDYNYDLEKIRKQAWKNNKNSNFIYSAGADKLPNNKKK